MTLEEAVLYLYHIFFLVFIRLLPIQPSFFPADFSMGLDLVCQHSRTKPCRDWLINR